MTPGRGAGPPLTSGTSVRAAVSNDAAAGAKVCVSLLASGIHVMPVSDAGT